MRYTRELVGQVMRAKARITWPTALKKFPRACWAGTASKLAVPAQLRPIYKFMYQGASRPPADGAVKVAINRRGRYNVNGPGDARKLASPGFINLGFSTGIKNLQKNTKAHAVHEKYAERGTEMRCIIPQISTTLRSGSPRTLVQRTKPAVK